MTKDERKKTRDYLNSARDMNRELNELLERREYLLIKITSPSIRYSSDRVQTSGSKDMLGDIVSEIRDLQVAADKLTDDYVGLKIKIRDEINTIEDVKYRDVLTQKYVDEKKNGEIADTEDIPYKTCVTRIRKGEEEFYKKYHHNI